MRGPRQGRSSVGVVVPLTDRPGLSEDEQLSLRHLLHYIGHYDRFLVVSEAAPPVAWPGFGVRTFPRHYFGSAAAHNRLLLSAQFYRAFADYDFILIYHLDALVFADRLQHWCEQGYDYIGAPWIPHPEAPYAGNAGYEGKVGNGGFSLRRVASFLRVIDSQRLAQEPSAWWRQQHAGKPLLQRLGHYPKRALKHFSACNGSAWERRRHGKNEEHFWANRAGHYHPDFRIAPLEVALQFAFECVPRYCFERNGGHLPFGCHAWGRYDRSFWEPFLLRTEVTA
jgi:hypothetical protein